MHTCINATNNTRYFVHSIQPHQASYIRTKPISKTVSLRKGKKTNPRVCVYVFKTRMSAVVLTDLPVLDPFPSDEDIRIDNAHLDALAESVTRFVDSQIFCFGLIYLLLGCRTQCQVNHILLPNFRLSIPWYTHTGRNI
jgi:hypothetical protein